MKLKASEWKAFTDNFPRNMTHQCENNWDEYQSKLTQLSAMTPELFDLEIDVEHDESITPEAYKLQCIKEASRLTSEAAWAMHYNGRNAKFNQAAAHVAAAFSLAHRLAPNTPDWHEALACAHYARAAVWRGNSKLIESFEMAKTAFIHMQAIADRIHPETWVHAHNQMALGLRYVEGRLEEACEHIAEAERMLASMDEPLALTQKLSLNMFLLATEGPATPRHNMNKGAIYAKAGLNVAVTDESALEGLPKTPMYTAYANTSRATEFMATGNHNEAFRLAHEAYRIYLEQGKACTENALSTLLTLVEAGTPLNKNVRTYYVTARTVQTELKLGAEHDLSKRLYALEPQMQCNVVQTPFTATGLSITATLARDNEIDTAQDKKEDDQKATSHNA